MHPSERVRIVVETARAVLAERIDPGEAAAALELQSDQICGLLRSDRLDVTQSEADSVALTLRRLGEQVADAAASPDHDAHQSIARVLGELAQALR